MNNKKVLIYTGAAVLLAAIMTYVYGLAYWNLPYPCSDYNFHNATMCVHCYPDNFKCSCQQFEMYNDVKPDRYDCNICPPYKVGDLWSWMNCANLTNEFTIGG